MGPQVCIGSQIQHPCLDLGGPKLVVKGQHPCMGPQVCIGSQILHTCIGPQVCIGSQVQHPCIGPRDPLWQSGASDPVGSPSVFHILYYSSVSYNLYHQEFYINQKGKERQDET